LKNIAYGSKNPLMGLQQNLMSNSLSITSTSMTPATSSKSSSKSQAAMGKKSSKDPQVSITKSDASKFNSLFSSIPVMKLPDLPKSLSITPSMPSATTKQNRVSDKAKVSKSKASANFGRSPSLLSITQEPTTAGMQASYQDFLKNYIPQQGSAPAKQKPSSVVVSPSSSSSSTLLKPQKHKSSSQIGPAQSKKSHIPKSVPYDFGKNIASSFSGLPLSSPTLSISPFAHSPSLSPSMSAGSVVSPQKTLQQKLAERKQQNQQPKKKQGKFFEFFFCFS
jgi:hypothetical protein